MSETPETNAQDSAPSSPAPRPKRSPLTIIAAIVVALLVLGGAAFAAVMIISQQQQLNDLTQRTSDLTDASASASPSVTVDTAARDAAASDLTESINNGETPYTDSEGHVSDESLRTALRSALDAAASAIADPSSTAADLEAAQAAIENAAAAVQAAHVANWNDINGAWCSDVQGCLTITGLRDGSGDVYTQNGTPDANGCLWGFAGPSGESHNAAVTFCPQGSALSDPPCAFSEDLTLDRLYVRQDCAPPFYRK